MASGRPGWRLLGPRDFGRGAMVEENFLDLFPIWGLFVGFFLAFSLAVGAGYWVGLLAKRRDAEALQQSRAAPGATAIGGMLALIGFILAFSFGMAGAQYEKRRHLVIQDANAIGTAFLRADLLPEPHASQSRRLIGDYVAQRHRVEETAAGRRNRLAREEAVHARLWAEASAAANKQPSPLAAAYIQSLNQVIDLHTERVQTIRWLRIPDLVFAILATLSILALFVIGYHLALNVGSFFFPSMLLVVTYAVVFNLVIDLDRPRGGFFQVSQQPMIDASESIAADLKSRPPREL